MQLGIFLVVGICSTLAYGLLYLGLRSAMSPWWANFTALLATAAANTAANRRFTFGVRGPRYVVRHQLQGLVIFSVGLAATSGSLALLHAVSSPSRGVEVVVLTTANLGVTVLRFVAMKLWVFVPGLSPRGTATGSPAATRPASSAARRD